MNDVVEIDVKEAVRLGATSLTLFGKLFFPKTFRQKSPQMHEEIGRVLYGPDRYVAFEVFRDGAKTSLLRVFTGQRISYAISRTIMYVSVSQPHAVMSLRWLKRQVQYNTKWTSAFGLKQGDKWTDEWLEIKHEIDDVTITVLAMGITGQIRGFNPDDFRPDLIIIDDILNEENTNTDEQRSKIESLLFGALLNSLAPESEAPFAKAVFLQTPLHRLDAIEKCMADPHWRSLRFSCFDENGESRWPERWPTEVLKREKEAAILRGQYRLWMREKECKIVSGESQAIDVTKLRYWRDLPDNLVKVISVDPASSDSPKADDHVVMTVGFAGNDVYVLAIDAAKGVMPDKAAASVFSQWFTFQPITKICVEKVAYQRVLKWYLEREMERLRIFVPIDGIDDRRRKADRIMQAIPGLVAYGHLYIHESMTDFISQADDYDPRVADQKDDMLDALAMAITAINPALRHGLTIEGEYSFVDEDYERPLRLAQCP